MAVRMELSRILIRELTDVQLIELTEAEPAGGGAARSFPIVIGLPEAQAIERRLAGLEPRRPQTHDLLGSVIAALGARLESVSITDLSEGTFFARLDLRDASGAEVKVDARPSDAIALGIASRVPIWVDESVIEAAAQPEPDDLEL
ncbi:MAG: bifunctional nuclease family protein [Planctomycetota bacterium]|nr:MAG: bifunctional nuclease family protein [Planctomycetota bacterium]